MYDVDVICRVPRSELCYFRYTVEAYEGLCIATTLPGGEGRVRLSTSQALRRDLIALLQAMAKEISLEIESRPGSAAGIVTRSDPHGGAGP